MKLEIQTIWSPDLDPPSEGLPDELGDFDIFMQVLLGEAGEPGVEFLNREDIVEQLKKGNLIYSQSIKTERFPRGVSRKVRCQF